MGTHGGVPGSSLAEELERLTFPVLYRSVGVTAFGAWGPKSTLSSTAALAKFLLRTRFSQARPL